MDKTIPLHFGGEVFLADTRRALFWPEQSMLIVADLHIGKAQDFTGRGTLLPPYELEDMAGRLCELIDHYRPKKLVALGDSFHRKNSSSLLDASQIALFEGCMAKVEQWIFIEGNHDRDGLAQDGWEVVAEIFEKNIRLLHQPDARHADIPKIMGHFHPKLSRTIRQRGRITKPCFVWDDKTLILPAFGTYTGGLDVESDGIARCFADSYCAATADTLPHPLIFNIDRTMKKMAL